MRGKKAKQLRRQAEAETVGLPVRKYETVRRTRGVHKGAGIMKVLDGCQRSRYQQAKKAAL